MGMRQSDVTSEWTSTDGGKSDSGEEILNKDTKRRMPLTRGSQLANVMKM